MKDLEIVFASERGISKLVITRKEIDDICISLKEFIHKKHSNVHLCTMSVAIAALGKSLLDFLAANNVELREVLNFPDGRIKANLYGDLRDSLMERMGGLLGMIEEQKQKNGGEIPLSMWEMQRYIGAYTALEEILDKFAKE